MITYTACALAVIFATFVGISYYINYLQRKNVDDAVELAREQASSMALEIRDMVLSRQAHNLDDPEVRSAIKAVTHVNLRINNSIMWAAVISPNGDRMIEENANVQQNVHFQRGGQSPDVSKFSTPSGDKMHIEVLAVPDEKAHQINMPILDQAKNVLGQISLRVTDNPAYQRLEKSSRQITLTLIIGCLMMLLFLLMIFWILWRLFSRQLVLQQKNERLDRMAYVGTLASGLAHEIRNPLSSMSVNLEVIREELDEIKNETLERPIELSRRVLDEVQHLNRTLTSFLDFALPSKEGMSQFSLKDLIVELIELHDEQCRQLGICAELDPDYPPQTIIEADRRLLHQAIRNVLLNAIQVLGGSVKKGVRIAISDKRHDYLLVSITDTGPGIPEENLPRIFDVFYSTRKGGSGFGLAITRKIIQEHGGRIWAENNKESRGVTFYLELPRFAKPQEPASL